MKKYQLNLTGHCLYQFTEWHKKYEPYSDFKQPAYEYFLRKSIEVQSATLIAFFDKSEIYVKATPYIGGGCPVFYGSIVYRKIPEFVDVEEDLKFNDEPYYSEDRTEIYFHLFNICNRVYNESYLDEFNPEIINNEEDLPF